MGFEVRFSASDAQRGQVADLPPSYEASRCDAEYGIETVTQPVAKMTRPVIDKCGHTFDLSVFERLQDTALRTGQELRCPISQRPINMRDLHRKVETVDTASLAGLLQKFTDVLERNTAEIRSLKVELRVRERQVQNLSNASVFTKLAADICCYGYDAMLNEGIDRAAIAREIDQEAAQNVRVRQAEPVRLNPEVAMPGRFAVDPDSEENRELGFA